MRTHLRHLLFFLTVGLIVFAFDVESYRLLTRSSVFLLEHYLIVSVVTGFLAVLLGYWLNSHVTFGRPVSRQTLQRYGLVYVSGIAVQNTLLGTAVGWYHWPDILAKIGAIIMVAICWNFPLAKWWVFRYNQDGDEGSTGRSLF